MTNSASNCTISEPSRRARSWPRNSNSRAIVRGQSSTVAGSLLIIISAVAFGFMALFAKWARGDGVSTEMLLFLRFGIAGGALALWILIARSRWPRGRDLLLAIIMGAALYAGMSTCYF